MDILNSLKKYSLKVYFTFSACIKAAYYGRLEMFKNLYSFHHRRIDHKIDDPIYKKENMIKHDTFIISAIMGGNEETIDYMMSEFSEYMFSKDFYVTVAAYANNVKLLEKFISESDQTNMDIIRCAINGMFHKNDDEFWAKYISKADNCHTHTPRMSEPRNNLEAIKYILKIADERGFKWKNNVNTYILINARSDLIDIHNLLVEHANYNDGKNLTRALFKSAMNENFNIFSDLWSRLIFLDVNDINNLCVTVLEIGDERITQLVKERYQEQMNKLMVYNPSLGCGLIITLQKQQVRRALNINDDKMLEKVLDEFIKSGYKLNSTISDYEINKLLEHIIRTNNMNLVNKLVKCFDLNEYAIIFIKDASYKMTMFILDHLNKDNMFKLSISAKLAARTNIAQLIEKYEKDSTLVTSKY